MSKTNYLQAVISDLQRTAGPYRCAITGREQMQQRMWWKTDYVQPRHRAA
jgi:hypothetical protein